MGQLFGRVFVRNDKIDGQGKAFLLFAKSIHLQKYEVDRIFEVFCSMEDPATHLVEISKILTTNKLPYNLICSVILQIYDRNKLGYLNFMEYVMAMWCFLATDENELARTCFGLFDTHKTNSLDVGEIKYLVNMIWHFKPSKKCTNVLKKLEQNTDGVVTKAEFVLLNKHHKELLKPLRKIKDRLQSRTVYKRYWRQLASRRIELFGEQSMYEICNRTETAYVASSMEYLNLRTDVVPPEFIEQWHFIQRRKANRGVMHQELPYEIKDILTPHPLNVHTRKTLRSVAKGMTLASRFRKKSHAKISVLSAEHDGEDPFAQSEHTLDNQNESNFDTMPASKAGNNAGNKADNRAENRAVGMKDDPPPMPVAPKKFDDSFLGSLKAR